MNLTLSGGDVLVILAMIVVVVLIASRTNWRR